MKDAEGNPLFIFDDNSLLYFLKQKWKIFTEYDFVVIDEVQDATVAYVAFFKRILNNLPEAKCLVLGDKRQTIYVMKGSASCCLNNFDDFVEKPFKRLTLSTSYRVPAVITDNLNADYLQSDVLSSFNDGGSFLAPLVESACEVEKSVYDFIKTEIKNGANYDDFFILGLSVNSPEMRNLRDYLIENGVPVYYPLKDSQKTKNDELTNKLVMQSIYQAKGRERRFVILPYLTTSAYSMWLKDAVNAKEYKTQMPNIYYVAYTRAKEAIFAPIHDYTRYKFSEAPAYVSKDIKSQLNSANQLFWYDDEIDEKVIIFDFKTDPTKFADQVVLSKIENNLKKITLSSGKKPNYKIEIPTSLKVDNLTYETEIQLLNAQFLLWNYLAWRHPDVLANIFKASVLRLDMSSSSLRRELFENINAKNKNWNDLTAEEKLKFLACLVSLDQRYGNTVLQLNDYTWLNNFKKQDIVNNLFNDFKIKDNWLNVYLNIGENSAFVFNDSDATIGNRLIFNEKIFRNTQLLNLKVDLINDNRLFFFIGDNANISLADKLQASWSTYLLNKFADELKKCSEIFKFDFAASDEDYKAKEKEITQLASGRAWDFAATAEEKAYLSRFISLLNSLKHNQAWFLKHREFLFDGGPKTAVLINYITGAVEIIKADNEIALKTMKELYADKMSESTHDEPFSVKKAEFDALWAEIENATGKKINVDKIVDDKLVSKKKIETPAPTIAQNETKTVAPATTPSVEETKVLTDTLLSFADDDIDETESTKRVNKPRKLI